MALTNAEKQQRRRERLRARGWVHVQGWVTPAQAEAIRAIMQDRPVAYKPEEQPVTDHQPAAPEPKPAQEPIPAKGAAGPSRQTIAKWKREAEKRIHNGLTAILDHFNEHIRYEGMSYAGIRDLLSEADYEIACRVEIRTMQGQGLNGAAIAKALNQKAVPPPARSGKGTWTVRQVRALMARGDNRGRETNPLY